MRTAGIHVLLFAASLAGTACSGSGDGAEQDGPTGGGSPVFGPAGGSSGFAGAAGSGGVGGTGGDTATGGAGGTGGTGGIGGTGGDTSTGGQAGTGGMLDAGGGSAVTLSAGCSNGSGRPAGGVVTVAQGHYFTFPDSYDGTTPFPVLMGFHGCGSVNRGTTKDDTEWIRLTDGTAFETDYVRAVPLSEDSGGCWNYANDITRVTAMYDALLADHCVDTGRVFATGHSSGAQFIVQILTQPHTADAQHLNFKAVAPVAASDYGALAGPMPVMYIQGMMDTERGNGDGHETVARFTAVNGCGSTSVPYTQVAGCQSGATAVNPGCISYEGCQAPTIWCSHNDPAYGDTMHGVPCFGVQAMRDFFEGLP